MFIKLAGSTELNVLYLRTLQSETLISQEADIIHMGSSRWCSGVSPQNEFEGILHICGLGLGLCLEYLICCYLTNPYW